ncbi:helix-turn-helix domain-containing protein [Mycobacterium stomatepiae]|uniref:helix-turn-helix domain-containing protein n=1 Tax=Mycobacterium stomatepiae TaxID=470076 RepID=UPI0035563793
MKDATSRYVSPARRRQRITAQLCDKVVAAYESGQTSRQVAEELALGWTTVLKILKAAGVTVRPQGRRHYKAVGAAPSRASRSRPST